MDNWETLVVDECRLKGYSEKTIKSYCHYVGKFLESGKCPREYILSLIKNKKSDETVRAAGFAIKFYLRLIGEDETIGKLPNVKRAKKLPVILSKEEIEKLVKVTTNINHRLIIQVGYSAGLRLSEIINLKWKDIDMDRNLIHIKNAKGKKDRIVMLSKKVKEQLLMQKQGKYVFETNRGTKYSGRMIQKIIENATKNAGITKKIKPHTLRHSFATHLLEKGTDIRYIKELLGHSDMRTTLIYTKVSNKNISCIKSPLD